MKKIAVIVLLVFFTMSLAIGAISYSVRDFLMNIQINTTQMPIGWVRGEKPVFDGRYCYWADFSRVNEVPKVGWVSAWDFIQTVMIPTFGNPPLTDAQKQFCFGDLPAIVYVVTPNGTKLDRPMYDGDLWLATRDTTAQWKEIGRVKVGTACEAAVIRKTTYEYHWTTSNGLRGLSVCKL